MEFRTIEPLALHVSRSNKTVKRNKYGVSKSIMYRSKGTWRTRNRDAGNSLSASNERNVVGRANRGDSELNSEQSWDAEDEKKAESRSSSTDFQSTPMASPEGSITILFAAGGTGGHVYPAIAIADAVKDASEAAGQEVRCEFAGSRHRMEWEAVPKAGYSIHHVPAFSFNRSLLSLSNFLLPFRLFYAVVRSMWLILRLRARVVLGTGGYISLPTCIAAFLLNRPVVIQEQNAHPGLANRVLARRAAVCFLAFKQAEHLLNPRGRVVVSGNPTRSGLGGAGSEEEVDQARRHLAATLPFNHHHHHHQQQQQAQQQQQQQQESGGDEAAVVATAPPGGGGGVDDPQPGGPWVVVLGGSLGAEAINSAVLAALKGGLLEADLGEGGRDGQGSQLTLIWQTGHRYLDEVRGEVPAHPRLAVVPYLDRMDLVYRSASLVVSRAGAVTCSELVACRAPALLVPSPNVTANHQHHNAHAFQTQGVAKVLDETKLNQDTLAANIIDLVKDVEGLEKMRKAASEVAPSNVALQIAQEVLRLAYS